MGKSWLKTIRKHTGRIVLLLNMLAAIGLWLCCISTWVEPASWPNFSIIGLAFPAFLLADLCFLLVWPFINWRRTWIPLATIAPCMSYVLDYFPVSANHELPDGCVKIITWNAAGFGFHYEDQQEGKRLTIEYLKKSEADIICLQESSIWEEEIREYTDYLDSIGFQRDRYMGNYLFTRYPILESDTLCYDTHTENGIRGNGSKWYKLLIDGDTVLLVNNHLESNCLRKEIKEKYVENLDQPKYEQLKESGRSIGSLLRKSTILRGQQADSLVLLTKRFEGLPMIMCGDMNDTPISYTYQRLKSVLKSAFRESGNGVGVSFNERGFWVRIDHLFVSKEWKTFNTYIDNSIRTSDHYPLVSWLKME